MKNKVGKQLMSVVAVACCMGASVANAGWADGVAIPSEAAFFAELDLSRPALEPVRLAVEKEDWPAAKEAWGKYLETHVLPRWIWSHHDRDAIAAYLKERGQEETIVAAADAILRREKGLGGERDVDWTKSEVMNRHGCMHPLGTAWMVTGEAKYADDWAYLMRDWIADSPVSSDDSNGPWHRLSVSARPAVWFSNMNRFVGADVFDAELRYQMTRSLIEHAKWLYRNKRLERRSTNNILTGMANALAYVSIMLPEAKEAADWQKLAIEKRAWHMQKDVYPDGAFVELTQLYNYWVTHQFLELLLLAKKNDVALPDVFERHEKMYEFLLHTSTPDRGWMPLADSDDGFAKMATGMATGALLYGREDMRWLGPQEVPPGLIWQFPIKTLESYATMPAKKPSFNSHMMPYAQYGVMRTGWEKDDRWLLFDCAPFGGPHTHCDQHQVLVYAGRDLLIDPGTCDYKAKDRPYYISNEAHNVLLIDGKGTDRRTHPEVVSWSLKDHAEFASSKVENSGYMHQRSVLFVKPDYWVVVDHIIGKAPEEAPALTRLFHLAPGEVTTDANSVRTTFEQGQNIWVHAADGASLRIRDGLAVIVKGRPQVTIPVAVFESHASIPATLTTLLVPFANEAEIPTVERLASDDETARLKLTFADGRTDWIAMAPDERELKVGPHHGTGMALCVRADAKGKNTSSEAFGEAPLVKTEKP